MSTEVLDVYTKIITLLDACKAEYRVVDHVPEGRTEVITQIRGNQLAQAAKAIVVMVKIGKKDRRYYMAVIPGDKRLNLEVLKARCHGTHVMFAPTDIAEKLTACVTGAIPPFSFNTELELVVDPLLLENQEIVFNAGRLDRSVFVKSDAFLTAAVPKVLSIAV